MQTTNKQSTDIAGQRLASRWTNLSEIAIVFSVGIAVVLIAVSVAGRNLMASIGAVWGANGLMLALIYCGLKRRGQGWSHFGLATRLGDWRAVLRTIILSVPVFVAATAAFVLGAIVMASIVGRPEQADMSKYDAFRGHLMRTILALLSVYLVSSFSEEVIYRGFLITRLTEVIPGNTASRCLAVVVSAGLFGLIHSDWGIAGMVQASLMGLALGYAYLAVKRNLWVNVLAHGYMDTILVVQIYLAAP